MFGSSCYWRHALCIHPPILGLLLETCPIHPPTAMRIQFSPQLSWALQLGHLSFLAASHTFLLPCICHAGVPVAQLESGYTITEYGNEAQIKAVRAGVVQPCLKELFLVWCLRAPPQECGVGKNPLACERDCSVHRVSHARIHAAALHPQAVAVSPAVIYFEVMEDF